MAVHKPCFPTIRRIQYRIPVFQTLGFPKFPIIRTKPNLPSPVKHFNFCAHFSNPSIIRTSLLFLEWLKCHWDSIKYNKFIVGLGQSLISHKTSQLPHWWNSHFKKAVLLENNLLRFWHSFIIFFAFISWRKFLAILEDSHDVSLS